MSERDKHEALSKIEYTIYTLFAHSDAIAAGKQNRWDVVKWGVTVNTALVVASTIVEQKEIILLGCIAVTLIAILLVWFYNASVTGHRKVLKHATLYANNSLEADCANALGKAEFASLMNKTTYFDWREMTFYTLILTISSIPVIAVWLGIVTIQAK